MLFLMTTRREFVAALALGWRREAIDRLERVMGPMKRLGGMPRHEVVLETREGALARTKIRFEAEPGDWTPAWLLRPATGRVRHAAICLHQTTRIGKDEPAGLGGLPNLHYARELAERGFATLTPDYPNFGEYKRDVYAMGYASATMKGIMNHRQAARLLCKLAGVKGVAAIGHSLGGHNALFLAAFEERVLAVATSCGFTSFAKYYGGHLKGWSHKGYMPRIESVYGCDPKRMPFDFPDVLRLIAPRAVFVNAPLHDENFDAGGVDDCIRAVRPYFRDAARLVVEHPDCGHDFPPEVRERCYGFLERQLAQA